MFCIFAYGYNLNVCHRVCSPFRPRAKCVTTVPSPAEQKQRLSLQTVLNYIEIHPWHSPVGRGRGFTPKGDRSWNNVPPAICGLSLMIARACWPQLLLWVTFNRSKFLRSLFRDGRRHRAIWPHLFSRERTINDWTSSELGLTVHEEKIFGKGLQNLMPSCL